ncbi:hypothetical protein EYB25_009541 [Talaromyces marneffei]|nr:hypothetical protein EYB25_009541 [Talaromyces marneffei]
MELLDPALYTVAWIAPLEIEARAALHILDNRHRGQFPWRHGYNHLFHAGDINRSNVIIATVGLAIIRITKHRLGSKGGPTALRGAWGCLASYIRGCSGGARDIVIPYRCAIRSLRAVALNREIDIPTATLPEGEPYGTGSAAALASEVKTFFPNIQFGLLVGVAAGLPNLSRTPARDIRLGDVLVGLPEGESAGLVAYDLGKETKNGFQPLRSGHTLAMTEKIVRAAIGHIKIEAPNEADIFLPFYESIKDKEHANGTFRDPGQDHDEVYEIDEDGTECLVKREQRQDSKRIRVWYGPIGSGEKLIQSAEKRNELRDKYNIIGLETAAAGIMNQIPVGVIRGVCDYGDEHKKKEWQPYAAAMAAAYAKAVLYQISPKSGLAQNVSTESGGRYQVPIHLTNVPAIDSFLERYQELQQLWHHSKPGNSKSQEASVLHGIGGTGKTQLAIPFAQDPKDDFSTIF